jgi:hypothetical protein
MSNLCKMSYKTLWSAIVCQAIFDKDLKFLKSKLCGDLITLSEDDHIHILLDELYNKENYNDCTI